MEYPDQEGRDAGSPPLHVEGATNVGKNIPLSEPSKLSIQSKAVISESKVWLDLATQSRLRIENMRTMHRLAFSSARARWTAHLVEESYKTGQAKTQDIRLPRITSSTSINLPDELTTIAGFLTPTISNKPAQQGSVSRLDPLYRLPEDILISIFSYLSFPEIIAAQRVSRGWLSYLVTEPRLYRSVSFLNSKHQIPLKALRAAIAISHGRILSLEFHASTLVHLTPLAPIYPHLRRLLIKNQTDFMSTVFRIAFQMDNSNIYYGLPNLRKAIFEHGILLSNEVITLLSMAPNLEELECRSARVILDLLGLTDNTTQWKLKRLSIRHYSEEMTRLPAGLEASVHARLIRTPAILRFLPYLEELTLGIDSLQVMDLTLNTRLRYLDFLPRSAVVSFIQPPASLQVCLNAPVLNRHLPDAHPTIWPPENDNAVHIGEHVQLWGNPPRFESVSLAAVPSDIDILPRALCNSYDSLKALRMKFVSWNWAVRNSESERVIEQQLNALPSFLTLFENLRYLDVSESKADDSFLARLPVVSLEYLCLARTSVTSSGAVHFLLRSRGKLRGINLVETQVGGEVGEVAETLGVKMETTYPGHPMPGVIHSSY